MRLACVSRVDTLTEVAPGVALAPFIVPGSQYRVVYRPLDERPA